MRNRELHWKTRVRRFSKAAIIVACAIYLVRTCNRKAPSEWVFETQARPLVDSPRSLAPQLAALPSGVVLATVVEPGAGAYDLSFYTSPTGGDIFTMGFGLNARVGDVHPMREGTPRLLIGRPGNYCVLWTGTSPTGQGISLFLARSEDYGQSFSSPVPLDLQSGGSHPYFNAALAPAGTLIVVWIAYDAVCGAVADTGVLQLIRSTDGGRSFSAPVQVAVDVCPCCRPELKTDGQGNWYLAWRHVDADQGRDIVAASSHDDGVSWTAGVRVSHDGWHVEGCPYSGPSLALLDGEVFIAWHTVVGDQQKLFWSRSDDGGRYFDRRRDLAGTVRDPNHPYLAKVGEHLLVAFQGRDPDQRQGWGDQRIYLREIAPTLSSKPIALAHGPGSASYPVAVALGPDELMTAWTDSSEAGEQILSVRGYLKQTP
jgi:hypothetical protein